MKPYSTKLVWLFFLITFAFSVPFVVMGAFVGLQLVPGVPFSGLAVVCPIAAALLLSYRRNGRLGMLSLLKRSFDIGRVRAGLYLLPLVLLMPVVMTLSYLVLRLTGTLLPPPRINFIKVLVLFIAFFIGALGEELGWSGFATDPLQGKFGALPAALIIGVVWAVWHYGGLHEAHRSLYYISWWTLGTVASRIIIVWLYTNTGRSVFAATLFHALMNLTWQLFPVDGSYYDPRVTSLILAVVAIAISIVWRPTTLERSFR